LPPRYRQRSPGAAHEARIYWDAGTGEIDFAAPYATAPWPDGIETQNIDERSGAPDFSVPAASLLAAHIVQRAGRSHGYLLKPLRADAHSRHARHCGRPTFPPPRFDFDSSGQ